jgi:hypothetical protein
MAQQQSAADGPAFRSPDSLRKPLPDQRTIMFVESLIGILVITLLLMLGIGVVGWILFRDGQA